MKMVIKILAAILGAAWFFPVSCTTGTIIVIPMLAETGQREAARGDEMHSPFRIVAITSEDGKTFQATHLSQLADFQKEHPDHSFIMAAASDEITGADSKISYQVLETSESEQLIEVTEDWLDGDGTNWSRYRATEKSLTPVSSRMIGPGTYIIAGGYSFIGALLLLIIGRLLRRIIRQFEKTDPKTEIEYFHS